MDKFYATLLSIDKNLLANFKVTVPKKTFNISICLIVYVCLYIQFSLLLSLVYLSF